MGSLEDDLQRARRLIADRASMPSHIVGFLVAWQHAVAVHQYLVERGEGIPEPVSRANLAHMMVFCVRSLETLFRDCFVLVAGRVPEFATAVAASTKGQISLADALALISDAPVMHELLAAKRKLQNLDAVNSAFEALFGMPALDFVEREKFLLHRMHEGKHILMPTRIAQLQPTWRTDLYALFAARHTIIHNAHSPLPSDPADVARMTNSVLVFGQLFATAIGDLLKAGVLCIRAPRDVVEDMSRHVMRHVPERTSSIAPAVRSRPPRTVSWHGVVGIDGSAHVGPFIFSWRDLSRTTFDRPSVSLKEPAYGHLVDPQEDGSFRVQSLWAIRSQDG